MGWSVRTRGMQPTRGLLWMNCRSTMTSDGESTAERTGMLPTILGWIGVHAAFGADEDAGCARRGCGCGQLLLVAITAIVLGNWFVRHFSYALWSVLFSVLFFLGGSVVSLAVGQLAIGPTTARRMQDAGKITLGFGAACLVGVFAVMAGLPGTVFFDDEEVSPTGDTLGPITVEERTWVGVEVEQSIKPGAGTRYQRWSFVTAELLDQDKEYLSSFGGEFWHYAGYDDGAWEESEDEYQATLLIPSPGTYYVRLKTEANVPADELRPIEFTMEERAWWGHPRPLQRSAYAAFFLGALLFLAPWMGRARRVRQALEGGGHIRYEGTTYAVRGVAQYEYPDWKATEWTLQPLDPDAKKPMFVEYEYEDHSDWDNWAVSRPVAVSAIQCGPAGKETGATLPEYLAHQGQAPETVSFDSRTYSFEGRGRAYRNGTGFDYRNYEGAMGGFLSVEGDDLDALDAVVGKSIGVRELAVVDDASA